MSTMKPDWKELFAEEHGRIQQRMSVESFEEIRLALTQLEERIGLDLNDDRGRLDLRRHTAKWTLYAAIDKKEPVEKCEELLAAVSQLGFARPQEWVTTAAVFARYCAAVGQKTKGYQYLLPAMTALESAPLVIASAPPELIEGYRRLLSELASG